MIAEQPPLTPEDLPGEPIEEDELAPASGADQQIPVEEDVAGYDMMSDPEEEELMAQMAQEAEEHARFTSSLNQKPAAKEVFDYDKELKSLRVQQRKDLRDADEVTSTMISECQHLLSLFGLPYITAPMEAEAQCAELVHLGLVDGIVTDDSDIFLFGGTRVYKNMFNQAKFVECYLASDLSSEFGLTRENLISCAELLGSDYTTGLPGVGPVTAVELLGEFGDLSSFVAWFTAVQRGEIPPADDKPHPVRRKFRRAHGTKLFLPPSFPDARVRDAYLHPQTDANPEAFRWGVPDLGALRRFLSATVGWSEERTDEVLVPVVRDMNRRGEEGTQANITRFFEGNVGAGAFAPRRREEVGARLGNALGRMRERGRRQQAQEDEDGGIEEGRAAETRAEASSARGEKRSKRKEPSVELSDGEDDGDVEYEEPKKKARKGAKKASKKATKKG
jgi:DNA excision repair protein ERCC-5